ncbi:MAG: ice-binding family protein [bacterium]|nr:ice-binding family protein [bacterium]
MKKFNINSLVTALAVSLVFGITGPIATFAATTPSLGVSATYGVLGSTYTNTSAGTTINGDVGFTTGPAVTPLGTHTNYGSSAPYATAGTDQGSALSALASQTCTFTFAGGAINLSTDTTHGSIGVYAPGVYCSSGAMDVGGPLTLSGSGTYIFRPVGALTTTAGAIVTLSGASACDVFWTPSAATTLAANTTFVGTVMSDAGITVGANTNWTGRSLAFGGTVTTDTDTITVPTCAVPLPPPPPPSAPSCTLSANPTVVQTGLSSVLSWTTTNATAFSINQGIGSVTPIASGSNSVTPPTTTVYTGTTTGAGGSATCNATVTVTAAAVPPALATLHVVKLVVNNSGGTAVASNFNLHVKLSGADVTGSPAAGTAAPGASYSLSAGTYNVSEDANASYAQSFSGACNSSGNVTLSAGDNVTCTITNDDIAAAPAPIVPPTPIVAPVPTLPNTGYAPDSQNIPWQIPVGILAVVVLTAILVKRKQIFPSR